MHSATKRKLISEASDQRFDFRNEAGASLDHNRITRNLNWLFWNFFKENGDCESFTSDLPVFSEAKKGVYYSDLVVSCSPEFEVCTIKYVDEITDTVIPQKRVRALKTPTLIAEVWSDSNSAKHKETKLEHYRQIVTLVEYLTVEQNTLEILRYVKDGDGSWKDPETLHGEHGSLELASFKLTLGVTEIYAKCNVLAQAG